MSIDTSESLGQPSDFMHVGPFLMSVGTSTCGVVDCGVGMGRVVLTGSSPSNRPVMTVSSPSVLPTHRWGMSASVLSFSVVGVVSVDGGAVSTVIGSCDLSQSVSLQLHPLELHCRLC